MVVNRSFDDRAGWDFLLEVPARAGVDKSGALDKSEPPVQVMVQVKATKARRISGIPIKLSNWQWMILSPLRYFVLIVQLDDRNACVRTRIWFTFGGK